MNFPSKEIELKKKKKKNTTKNGLNKDTLKIISPNQLTINSSKNSNSNIFILMYQHLKTKKSKEMKKKK